MSFSGHHLQHHQKYEVLGLHLAQERKDLYGKNHREDIKGGLNK